MRRTAHGTVNAREQGFHAPLCAVCAGEACLNRPAVVAVEEEDEEDPEPVDNTIAAASAVSIPKRSSNVPKEASKKRRVTSQ